MERGVKFDPEAIKKYDEASTQYAFISIINNKTNKIHEELDSSLNLVKANNTNPCDETARKIS